MRDETFPHWQIFCNLNTLSKCISNTLTTFVNDIKHSIKECFAGTDVAASLGSKKPVKESKDSKTTLRGPGKTPTLTTSQNFRSKLWAALEWLFDEEIFGYCNQVMQWECFVIYYPVNRHSISDNFSTKMFCKHSNKRIDWASRDRHQKEFLEKFGRFAEIIIQWLSHTHRSMFAARFTKIAGIRSGTGSEIRNAVSVQVRRGLTLREHRCLI